MKLNQLQFPGMPESIERQQPTLHRPTVREQRFGRLAQNRDRLESLRMRYEDEIADEFEPGEGPSGATGELSTEDVGLTWSPGHIPDAVSFHGSTRSAWRKFGSIKYVPYVGMKTPQMTVSARRFDAARTDPSTRSSPRFHGPGLEEVPRVYRDPVGNDFIVDGNHRISSALANGQLIGPARVVDSHQLDNMARHNHQIRMLTKHATDNPNRHPEAEDRAMRVEMGYRPSDEDAPL